MTRREDQRRYGLSGVSEETRIQSARITVSRGSRLQIKPRYADDSLVTVGANTYQINYNDTTGGQNFGGGDYANNVTLTAANTAAVPEASSFIFGGIVCIALAVVHFGRKLLQK
jgi:hypothetical protein